MAFDVTVEKRTLGVNFSNGTASVRVWAPGAEEVSIVLTNTQIPLPLQKEALGYWATTTEKIKPGDGYKVKVAEGKLLPDPASLSQPEGVHGPSAAIDITRFPWTDGAWENLSLSDYIIYEIHTGTFTPEGTFTAIEDKLDHLVELGITAIELMPVAQFPGSRNWGYDGAYPFAVQHSYGGAAGLQHLVNACHRKGLAVILDVVYNHIGPEGACLGEFGPYFTQKYSTPWGPAINFDDAGCDGVRRYFIENALMWFRDFGVDALRLDAVHTIKDFSSVHILREIKEQVDRLMLLTGRRYYLIAESDLNDTRFIKPLSEQGYGMDAQWLDEFHHALRVAAGGERTGYYVDFNGMEHLAKACRNGYVYDGQYSVHREKAFGKKTDKVRGEQFIIFSQNHDQVGNRMLGERTSSLTSFGMQKLLAGAVLLSPYVPMLFMGEEWSEPNPFLYFVSHTDAALAEAARKSRQEEFVSSGAEGEAPDPCSEDTFRRSGLQWALRGKEPHKTMLQYYKALIALRKQCPPLYQLNRECLAVDYNSNDRTLCIHRWQGSNGVLCLMNFSEDAQSCGIPGYARGWQQLFHSADRCWLGRGKAPLSLSEAFLILQPESFIIYSGTYV